MSRTTAGPPISAGASLMLAGGLGSQLVEFVGGVESHRRELSQPRGGRAGRRGRVAACAVALAVRSPGARCRRPL
jgi:hypothetical protein